MMKFILCFLLCALSLVSSAVAQDRSSPDPERVEPAGGPSGQVTEYGVYRLTGSRGTPQVNTRATSPTVNEDVGHMELIEKTAKVPAKIGLSFMFTSEIRGLPEGETEVDWVVEHPKITKPDGTTSTGYSYKRKLFTVQGLCVTQDGYMFDHDFELAEGEWSFAFVYQGKPLVNQTFQVYRP